MLPKSYLKEIFRPECNPRFESLHCIARPDQDISEVVPHLNAVRGRFEYFKAPRAVTFKAQGKLIVIQPKRIAVNALQNEEEADKILEEINHARERRKEITPSYEGAPKPKVLEILRLLPITNCRECGQPTCMVFATQPAEEGGAEDCPL